MLTTPTIDELINEYYDVAKEYFELNNIKISKTGVIGFLLYVLGHIKKDSEYYYNYLYKELFPLTAQEYQSLLLHASLFGYTPSFANPATYRGNITITLPQTNIVNLKRREIHIPKYTQFTVNELTWTEDADVTVIEDFENGIFYASFVYEDTIERIPIDRRTNPNDSSLEDITFDLKYLRQYENVEESFTVPYYDYGVYYRYTLKIDDGSYLADIKVYVKEPTSSEYEEYEVSFVKFGYTNVDKVVFISQISENEYVLEFGNGIVGYHLPTNAEVVIKYKQTKGSAANFFNGTLQLKDSISVVEYYIDGTVNNYTIDNTAVTGSITEAITDGKDIETVEELRSNILDYVKTRNLLVKFEDYKILLSSLYDYSFLFKKIDFVDNDIYIYAALRNDYYQPIPSISLALQESEFNPNSQTYLYKPEYTYIKQNKIPYPYPTEVYTTSDVNDANVVPVNDIQYFAVNDIIVFNNDITNQYTITTIDTTNNTITLDKNITVPANTPIQYVDNEKVDLISPFLYKYNSILRTYEGYLVKEDNIYFDVTSSLQNATIPNIYLTITLAADFSSLTFQIHNYINKPLISDYSFVLTIPQLNIYNLELDETNNYTYTLDISSIQDLVLSNLLNTIDIKINVIDSTLTQIATLEKNNYQLVYDITNFLILKKFYDATSGSEYIVQIPYISKDEYELNTSVIQSKLFTVLVNNNISENRVISTQHSFRFYNTLELYPIDGDRLKEEVPVDYINLPIQLKLYIKFDKAYIEQNNINILDAIEQIKLDVAKYLADNVSGDKIEFYTSKLEDLIHNYSYVKYVKVLSPDYNIVVNNYTDYLKSIANDKLKISSFCPVYFWWDVNNIDIAYDVE